VSDLSRQEGKSMKIANENLTVSQTEARAGRVVKGGAIRRILWVSLGLAIAAMLIAYLFV
jgi:hypothetical protein